MQQSESSLAVRIGIFFTLALIIVVALSFQASKSNLFKDRYEVVANFQQASGVEPGVRVTLRGVPIGTVKSMDWDAGINRVRVILQIEKKYEIPKNAIAKIQISSLLGGNVIDISVDKGPAEIAYLAMGDEIQTAETPSLDEVLTVLSELSSDTENLITSLNKNQADTLGRINEVIEENRGYIRTTSESFARVGPKLEELADRMNRVTESMESGEGTIGALYADKELYEQLKQIGRSGEEIAAKIRSGEGTLGSLIYGDEVITDARSVMEDLQRAAREVQAAVNENREGIRTLVAAMSQSGPKMEEAINNFNEIATKVNEGDGTLGRLVNDPTLYEDAQRAVNQVGESFESSEEQGVFRSFLGLVFGALI